MGSLFRSEEMSLLQFIMQTESAHSSVSSLGELGLIEFIDLNDDVNAFQRNFVKEVRRCDEMERKLRFLKLQLERFKIPVVTEPEFETRTSPKRTAQELNELESRLATLEEEVLQINKNEEVLNRNYGELCELKSVLAETEKFFQHAETSVGEIVVPVGDEEESTRPLLKSRGGEKEAPKEEDVTDVDSRDRTLRAKGMGFVTGVVEKSKVPIFERVMWRALRGNLFMKYAEIEEPFTNLATNEKVEKTVFIVFGHGQSVLSRVRQICDSFGATLYPCPDTKEQRKELERQVSERLADMDSVMNKTHDYRKRVFTDISIRIDYWQTMVRHQKAIFHTMNLFNWDVTTKCLIAEGWAPTNDIPKIRDALAQAAELVGSNVPTVVNLLKTRAMPPTFHRTNKFTEGFQVIVDAYGIASYREVNPAVFSLISFPFLFAVMFGDIGHGFLMFLAALFLVVYEKRLAKYDGGEIFETFFSGRYIILLMGLFSIYTGLIYNDIFSRGMAVFGESGWHFHTTGNDSYAGEFSGNVYPLGIDPGWHGADNYLIFTNSYKMKMSIIFGVIQMTFGIVLSLFNHIYFKRTVSIYNEFIPQLIFLHSIFGYLTFAIIFKWCSDWTTTRPPSLLNMLIYMFLSPGKISDGEYLYPHQETVQLVLLALALIAVPWMLLVKPLYKRHMHKKRNQYHAIGQDNEEEEDHHGGGGHGHGEGDEFDFGEIMVYQVIHTIEFCLGAISNTASYLRLWALSLAHAQLSVVLWDMTLGLFISMEPGAVQAIGLFLGFSGWFALTIGILLIMEGLSAFLHALRLHWVEFNNKFYEGTGRKFHPFTLDDKVEAEE